MHIFITTFTSGAVLPYGVYFEDLILSRFFFILGIEFSNSSTHTVLLAHYVSWYVFHILVILTRIQRTGAAHTAHSFHDAGSSVSNPYPRGEAYVDSRRKRTIISLLDVLNELSNESSPFNDANLPPTFEDDEPTVDEKLQIAGSEAFNRFERRIDNLDKELRNFANAARQLGSSVGILSSALRLRERLAKLLFLFRENAATLFPRKISRQPREALVVHAWMERRCTDHQPSPKAHPDPESIPDQFAGFAEDVVTFLTCLNEFPEFTDEAVNTSIRAFEFDLKYWSSCLQEYKGSQFRYPAVQRYIHDLTLEIGEHIDNITVNLSMFIEIGVPTIRFAQQHSSANLLNLSTVATFFSVVTATTLQCSYQLTDSVLEKSVNAFWFSSLVFSIAAAVNSLLGLTWKQAMYRSPLHRVPWWVVIWIKRSPLVFLVMAVACFSVGLMLFTYATEQAVTSLGLAVVSAWFASERWIFVHYHGHVWLDDAINEATHRIFRLSLVVAVQEAIHCCVVTISVLLRRVFTDMITRIRHRDHTLPTKQEGPSMVDLSHHRDMSISACGDFTERPNSTEGHAGEECETSRRAVVRQRFQGAVRSVIMVQQQQAGRPQRIPSFDWNSTAGMTPTRGSSMDDISAIRGPPDTLIPKLKTLDPVQDLSVHTALVRHLQFSPSGKYLATSSWDRSSVIFRVGEDFTIHAILVHVRGFIGQVAWSASDTLLLTRLPRGIKIWTKDGLCRKTIERPHSVASVAWLPANETQFLSVEGSEVFKLDIRGRVLDSYHFGRIKLHNVAVTPDGQRLLGVGPLLAAPNGMHPSRTTRVEKRIIVFNIESRTFENQTPVVNDVRDITMSKSGGNVLISFEHKTPPQLWKMELVRDTKDRENPFAQIARLTLRHTYLPTADVDFVGPSYFGGVDDQLVLCAGKAGDIHIWDRDTATLLHYIRPQAFGGDLTCAAWNHSTDDPFMLATGSHDGTVHIWKTPTWDHSSDDGSYLEHAGITIGDRRTSSPILGPPPAPGSCRGARKTAPAIRTTISQGSW
ncbi:WD40-repeat-containing domain protein [Suillus paluster]|uniref:WD40-repeat-containing domain protein n=1 Tax=Suillus paluster TaxID=48578 RepID=UPI001B87A56E|nr:WD40-repeat-containing domain protein [Suillus paluster]KAG1742685.1 WD40-repeat-containing domain protein [Suillus paluster]